MCVCICVGARGAAESIHEEDKEQSWKGGTIGGRGANEGESDPTGVLLRALELTSQLARLARVIRSRPHYQSIARPAVWRALHQHAAEGFDAWE